MPAYLVATMDVSDAEAYKAYQARVPALIEKHGGRYIVRGGERTVLEGDWPAGRTVVLEFPDYAAIRAFANDPDYAPIAAIRHAHTRSHMFMVDGAPGGDSGRDFGGYLLASISVENPETYKGYAAQVPTVIDQYGGTFLARGGRSEGLEETPDPDRVVLIGFSDVAGVRRFHGSDEYKPLIEIRHSASSGNAIALEAYAA